MKRGAFLLFFLAASPALAAEAPSAVDSFEAEPADAGPDPIERRQMQIHFLMGNEYFKEGNYRAAIEEWKEVLKIDPGHALAKDKIKRAREKLASGRARP